MKNIETSSPRFLTIPQAAKATTISARFLRDLHKSGSLPGFYVGQRFMVNMPALSALLDEKCRAESLMPETMPANEHRREVLTA